MNRNNSKEKDLQPIILSPAKLSLKNKGEIKTFIDKPYGELSLLADLHCFPIRNYKGNPSVSNGRTLDSHINPNDEIKSTVMVTTQVNIF